MDGYQATPTFYTLMRIADQFSHKEPVQVQDGPLPRRELRQVLRAKKPTLLRQQGRELPAVKKWDWKFLAARAAGLSVELSLGIVEQDGAVAQRQRLDRYIADLASEPRAAASPIPYLSLYPLFATFPDLQDDIAQADVFGPLSLRYRRAWIGPAGTVTGLHVDHYPNLLVQVRGRKGLLLFPPEQSALMYPSRTFDFGTTVSQIDLVRGDLSQFPRLREARATLVILEEADVLYNPPGWWHFVIALSPSISISCFASPPLRALTQGLWDLGKLGLHQLGLLARGDCLCHPRYTDMDGGRP